MAARRVTKHFWTYVDRNLFAHFDVGNDLQNYLRVFIHLVYSTKVCHSVIVSMVCQLWILWTEVTVYQNDVKRILTTSFFKYVTRNKVSFCFWMFVFPKSLKKTADWKSLCLFIEQNRSPVKITKITQFLASKEEKLSAKRIQ